MIERIKSKSKLISQNDFIKSVATLATGTVISQIIPLLLAPLISRLYNPTDYAVLATYSSITIIITIISTGMYDSALMLDKEDEQAVNTGALAVLITIGVTLASILIILVFQSFIINRIHNPGFRLWLYLVPCTVFFQGFYQTLNLWNNRKQRYKRLAANRIVMTAVTTSLTLLLGYLNFHEKGLIISLITGQAISFIILFIQTIKVDSALIPLISKAQLVYSLKHHKDFPKYNMPQGFLDALKDSSLVWIISFYFGNVALGSFSFAKSIIMRPLQVIGGSVSQVFYQRASKIYNETGDIWNISKRTLLNLVLIGLPFAILIFVFGGDIFHIIFGNLWKQAGVFSEILIFWLFISFVASPFGSVPIILHKQHFFFLFSIIYSVVPIIIIFLAGSLHIGVNNSIYGFSIANIIIMLTILLWIRHLLIQQKNKTTGIHLK